MIAKWICLHSLDAVFILRMIDEPILVLYVLFKFVQVREYWRYAVLFVICILNDVWLVILNYIFKWFYWSNMFGDAWVKILSFECKYTKMAKLTGRWCYIYVDYVRPLVLFEFQSKPLSILDLLQKFQI